MKVTFAFKECPLPADRSGSRRRASILLESFRRRGDRVDLIHFSDPGDPEIPGAVAIPRPNGGVRRRFQDWFTPGMPLFRPSYESWEMREAIRASAKDSDLVLLGQDQMAIYREAAGSCPVILEATDAWTLVLDSLIASDGSRIRQRYLRSHRELIARHIREHYHRFESVLVVSRRDADVLADIDHRIRTIVLPHAIDIRPFSSGEEGRAATVVFAGVMGHRPNALGAVRFVREVWPHVKSAWNGARFQIVGRDPSPDVLALASHDIEVAGSVPSIVPYLQGSWVAVCPMWSGAGMKTKVLEAMASSTPVVSTWEGVSGMPGAEEAGVGISDDPKGMASRIVDLLRSRELRLEKGRRLREYVTKNFSQQRIVEHLDVLLEERKCVLP